MHTQKNNSPTTKQINNYFSTTNTQNNNKNHFIDDKNEYRYRYIWLQTLKNKINNFRNTLNVVLKSSTTKQYRYRYNYIVTDIHRRQTKQNTQPVAKSLLMLQCYYQRPLKNDFVDEKNNFVYSTTTDISNLSIITI